MQPNLATDRFKAARHKLSGALASGFADRDVRYALVDAAVSANLGRLAPQLRSPRDARCTVVRTGGAHRQAVRMGPFGSAIGPRVGKISEVAAGSERQPAAEPALPIDREA